MLVSSLKKPIKSPKYFGALNVLKNHPEILINDLYQFIQPNHVKWRLGEGNVHYNNTGRKAQGREVAKVLLSQITN